MTRHRPSALLALLAFLLLVPACSGDDGGPAATTTTLKRAERRGPTPTPATSAEAAVRTHLEALQRGDTDAAFLLLSDESFVEGLADAADWARRRTQLPPITGFEITDTKDDRVETVLRHAPRLDPFVGLALAEERATYSVRKQRGGFLVDAEPVLVGVLPPEAGAIKAAAAWAARVQACDEPGAKALQAVDPIFVSLRAPSALCGSTGAVATGPVGRLEPGPQSQDIVSQYSTDALEWARVVPLTAPSRILVILAPLGNEWKVVGLSDL